MEKLNDVKTIKSGTEYIVLKIPKRLFNRLPEGYFFTDIEIKDIRGGKK